MGCALLLNSHDLGILLGDPTGPGTVSLSFVLFMYVVFLFLRFHIKQLYLQLLVLLYLVRNE